MMFRTFPAPALLRGTAAALAAALLLTAAPALAAPAAADDGPQTPPGDVRFPPELPADGRAGVAGAPGLDDTSAYMLGSTYLKVIFIENTHTNSTEVWTAGERTEVQDEVEDALAWWEATAVNYGLSAGPGGEVDFVTDGDSFETVDISISTEPISGSSGQGPTGEGRWIGPVLTAEGYAATGELTSYYPAGRAYAHDLRTAKGTDWAFVLLMVDSSSDGDGRFSDGWFAYSYLNGPFMVMTYDNDGWGIDRMEIVMAHEMGHIFGALDEYAGSCSDNDTHGYLVVKNSNCEAGGASEESMMRNAASQEFFAYPNHITSTPHRRAIGWRDSDGDGIMDPIDTVSPGLTPYAPDPAYTDTLLYTRTASVQAWRTNGQTAWVTNQDVSYRAVNINSLLALDFSHDGGPWSPVTLLSPPIQPDETTEDYSFTIGGLSSGPVSVQVRGIDRFGNIHLSTDTVTIDLDPPPVPVTARPEEGSFTSKQAVKLSCESAPTATNYRFQIATDPGFDPGDIVVDMQSDKCKLKTDKDSPLPFDEYYWRVSALDAGGNESAFSAPVFFTITLAKSPEPGESVPGGLPEFKWKSVKGAIGYRLVVSQNADLSAPEFTEDLTGTKFTPAAPLAPGTYYWGLSYTLNGVDYTSMPTWSFSVP